VSLIILDNLPCGDWIALEPAKPIARERQAGLGECIDAGSPAAFVAHYAGRFERLEVPRRGRPGMGEQAGNRAGAHLAAGEIEADQDAPPGRVSQCSEDGFISVRHE
jgi:hypothetical protein